MDEKNENIEVEKTRIRNPEELLEYLDKQTKWIIENPECFKDFLIAASIYDKGVGELGIDNKILIYSQNIDARYLAKREVWEDMCYSIIEGSYPILILNDKSIEELYDISQVNAEYPEEPRYLFRDLGEAAEGIVRVKPCEIVFSVMAPANRFAYYNYETNVISVTNGCKSYDSLFSDVACEYAHYEFARIKTERHIKRAEKEGKVVKGYKYQRKSHLFHAECAAYALSMMYGVNPGNYNMTQIHQSWLGMSEDEIRNELELILEAVSSIDERLQTLIKEDRGDAV